jgi:hypothetical protein
VIAPAASSEAAPEIQNHIQTHDVNHHETGIPEPQKIKRAQRPKDTVMQTTASSSDSSQLAPCKYAALREFIFTTDRKQLPQGIHGKVTLTSIIEDFRKANPSAELPCSLLSYLTWDEVLAAVTHNDISMLSMRCFRNQIRDVGSMHDKLRQSDHEQNENE